MFTISRKVLLLILLGAVITFLCIIKKQVSIKYKQQIVDNQSSNLYQYSKPSDNLINWLDELEKYECHNCPIDFHRKDSNGLFSYGCLQFQKETFLINLKKYYPETYNSIEGNEWLNLIYDCNFQKELAYKMIKDNPDNIWHWATSIRRGLSKPF
ncbi:MAG: hypothetical protein ACP5J8_02390 [Minisyncoccia bacterium]